jgi:diacylglycerol kinase family enzyme
MKLAVVLNEAAGTLLGTPIGRAVAEIEGRFAAAGVEARVRAARGSAVESEIRAALASTADAVVIGGGDGTVATAAGLLLGTGKALGLLPLGTMNLLARDLGMPNTLRDAIKVLALGHTRTIDVAEINGRVFLNNSVLGLFPTMVRARERQRGISGWRKWLGIGSAVVKSLRYYNLIEVTVDLGHGPRLVQTPALAVVNNVYHDRPDASFLDRPTLDDGRLAVYLANHRTRLGLIRLMVGLALGGWQRDAELESLTVTELTVTGHRRHRLRVAIDGEVARLTPPLIYRIRPKALTVLAPAPGLPRPCP